MLTGNQQSVQPSLSSQVLNQSPLRVVDATLATTFGLNEATFLDRLKFWLDKGYGTLHEGKRWIYNTYEQWAEKELPWLSRDQFKRIVKKLRDLGVLLVKRLRSHRWHQVNYYTIDEEALARLIGVPNASGDFAPIDQAQAPDDLYTVQTSVQTESKNKTIEKNNVKKQIDSKEQMVNAESEMCQNVEGFDEHLDSNQCSENDSDLQSVQAFHHELTRVLQFSDRVQDPWAYSQKIVDNLKAGSPSSQHLYDQWQETGTIVFDEVENNPVTHGNQKPQPRKAKDNQNAPMDAAVSTNHQEEKLQEWQIQPEDEALLEQGYQVGDIYPEFVQWCIPRLKYHPDLSDYAAKAHALKQLKFEPQLALELWRDFKRLLVREYQDKQELEAKGQPYFTPAWMQLPKETPVSEAKKASVALNEVKEREQEAMEGHRQGQPQLTNGQACEPELNSGSFLTAGEAEQPEEEQEEFLDPVEQVKNAIALIEKHPNNPTVQSIAEKMINAAKEDAAPFELEVIKQLENEAFQF